MVPMLSELWRLVSFLLRPENSADARLAQAGSSAGRAEPVEKAGAAKRADWAGLAKALLWACLSVLTGFGLAQLK